MNHAYRVIWNASQGIWQAVSELARASGGKSGRTGKAARRARALLSALLPLSIAAPVWAQSVTITGDVQNDWIGSAGPGSVTVDGRGASWGFPSSYIEVGESANGTLTIKNGGSVTSYFGFIGYQATGLVTVDGAGSTWTNSSSLFVGANGNGTLNITNGGSVISGNANIGAYANGPGTVTVDGAGSSWSTSGGELHVGQNAQGILNITNGGHVSSGSGVIGLNPAGTGISTVTVNGAGSNWTTNNANLLVGQTSAAILNIQNGGSVSSGTGYIGLNGTGTVSVDGTASSWTTNSNSLYVGYAGSGTLNITNGGSVSDKDGYVGNSGSGTVTVDGAGSSWTNSRYLFVGSTSTGSLSITGGGTVSSAAGQIGTDPAAPGTVTVDGSGSSWVNAATISVGNGGTGILNIARGGAVSSGVVSIGTGGNGTVSVDGAGSSLKTAGGLAVGSVSTGILDITNGGIVSSGAISIGTAGNGTVTVDGAGSSMSTSTPYGELVVGGGSTGILNISNAGNVSAGDVVLGNTATAAGSLNLKTGGVLQTGYVQKGPGSAAFTIDGGVLRPTGNQANFLQNFSAGDVSIASGGATIDTQGFAVGISAPMAGTGMLTKTGTGTLTLAGANTYSGGTTVTGGTVAISAANNLGTGPVTLYGSTLQNTAAVTLANPVMLGSGGTFQADANLTLSGTVTGAGSLTKQGPGTLTLTGANTYSGGTTITGGTVAISAANNLGTGQVALYGSTLQNTAAVTLANAVTLGSGSTFQADGDLTLSGAVTGAGSLTKQGPGTLTLAGANTYSGGTTITGGTVAISAADNLGTGQVTLYGGTLQNTSAVTLANPVTLSSGGTFRTDADLTLSNAVTGTGSLTKQGPGTLTIPGGNGWSGDTTLSGGTLTLDSYTQNSNQTLNINAASASDVGKLKVNGTATFNAGANIVVNVGDLKTIAVGQFFTGVISAGTLSASTFNVTANSALFNFKALLSGNTVNLAVVSTSPTAVYDAVNAYGLRQARGAAQTLDAQLQLTPTGDMVNVVTALGKLSDPHDVARAAAQTLPMNTGSQALMNTLSSFNRIVSDRTATGGTGLATGDATADKQVWIKPFGSHAWQNDENGAAGFSANTWGMALGAETDWDTTRLGLAYAYANTRVNGNTALSGTSSDATLNANVLALYGSRPVHGFDVAFQIDAGWNHSSIQRAISFSGLNRTANGSYGTWSAHADTGVSRPLPLSSDMTFIPEIRVDYTRLQSQSYAESGADALNLTVGANTVQALVFGVDGRLIKDLGNYGKINARLGVGYDTINDPGSIVAAYAGVPGQNFLTPGLTHSPWLMSAGVGYDYRTAGGTHIAFRYDVQARSGFVNQSASLKVSRRF